MTEEADVICYLISYKSYNGVITELVQPSDLKVLKHQGSFHSELSGRDGFVCDVRRWTGVVDKDEWSRGELIDSICEVEVGEQNPLTLDSFK